MRLPLRPLGLLLLTVLLGASAQAQYSLPTSIPGAFVDISATGTLVTAGDGDEGRTAVIDISVSGLTLPFYESNRTAFQMSNNGFLSFSTVPASIESFNQAMPFPSAPNAIIAPFWDDLRAIPGVGAMYYLADAANGRLIAQWSHYERSPVRTAPFQGDLTFQAHLYTDGRVEMHYAAMEDVGASYTTGVESSNGLLGVMRIINGDGEAVGTGVGVRFAPTTAAVPVVLQDAYTFANAGACFGASRGYAFLLTNQGGAPFTVTGATVTGSAAFSVDPGYAFPSTIQPGVLRTAYPLPVFFAPTTADSGVLTATVTLTTDAGPITLTVSGDADTGGAGIALRASVSEGTCGQSVTAPGTAFVPIAGHTRITAWTVGNGDSGRFALDLSALGGFPSFRLFGTDYTQLSVLANGFISGQDNASTTALPALPTTTAAPAILAASMNLKTDDTVAADDAGVGGAPGVFYGLSDVDGDGTQELVVTWWHAYDVGASSSPPASSLPGPAGQYLTAQAILFQSSRANEDDPVEIRILDGLDANGVPFRQNTDVEDASTDKAMENDAVTGITDPSGLEASIYRTRSGTSPTTRVVVGGPLYAPGGGSVGVRFAPEAQAVATGRAGWRMLAPPVGGVTVGRLAGLNLVQSVTGQYPSFASDNLYTRYDGAAFVPAQDVAEALPPGQGVLWYLFDRDIDPTGGPTPATDGTSQSYALPMRLEATGAEAATTLGTAALTLHDDGDGWNMLGNPFREDLDIANLPAWVSGGALASAVPQVWDPNAGATGSYTTVSGSIAAWQGFMLQNATATQLGIPQTARNEAGAFLGRSGQIASQSGARVGFELAATLADGRSVLDRAASLVFAGDAAPGWDLLDAGKLAPLAAAYATVGFQGTGHDGEPAVKAQESRPAGTESFSVPLVVDAAGTAAAMSLSWSGTESLPEAWGLELRDVTTGATVDLRRAAAYAFEQTAEAARDLAPAAMLSQTTTAAQDKAGAAPRFVLHVTTGRSTASEDGTPAAFALSAPAPNPTAGASRVAFDVPEATDVSVAVYDLLGRRVAVLADGSVAAGRHEARLDAQALAPGVYVVRMAAGRAFTATRRLTVVR